jgi:hypothetical protein
MRRRLVALRHPVPRHGYIDALDYLSSHSQIGDEAAAREVLAEAATATA